MNEEYINDQQAQFGQIQPGNPLFQPSIFQKDQDSIVKWLGLEGMEQMVNIFEHDLRGDQYKLDDSGEGKWEQISSPIMNERGIRFIVSTLRSVVCTPNTYYTIVNEEKINELCYWFSMELIRHLSYQAKNYGLAPENFEIIIEKFQFILELALRRSLNGRGIDIITSTEHTVRSINNMGQNQQKHTIWDSIFGFKW